MVFFFRIIFLPTLLVDYGNIDHRPCLQDTNTNEINGCHITHPNINHTYVYIAIYKTCLLTTYLMP